MYYHKEKKILNLLKESSKLLINSKTSEKDYKKCEKILEKINNNIKDEIHIIFIEFSQQTILKIPETAIKLNSKLEMAEFYLKYFLKNLKTENHFYVRALLLLAKLLSIKAKSKKKMLKKKKF